MSKTILITGASSGFGRDTAETVQAFPDAARAFRDVGLRAAPVMHLEVLVGAVAKELRAARPEVGKPGDVLEVVVWCR